MDRQDSANAEPVATTDPTRNAALDGPVNASPTGARLLGHNWLWFAVRAVAALLLGMAALFVPGLTLFTFALVFAAYSLIDGVAALISGLRGAADHRERWGMLVISGLAGIAIGVVFLIWPLVSTAAFVLVAALAVAAWALLGGAMQLAAAIRLRREIKGEWLLGLSGVLSLLLGGALLLLAFADPAVTALTVAWFIGFYALASGVTLALLAFRLRRRAAG